MNIESFIKDLSPELQEKARACKTTEELLKLADDNDIEISREALDTVSGGSICGSEDCPNGGKHEWEEISREYDTMGKCYIVKCRCKKCGQTTVE
ncbi:hypothetical protein SAMN04487934_103124 [Eubacterium ruminantium]|nr:hypothetical protein SAMN04487934_103124 [Eubacterium ruminantium]